jgi:hypothetical protein
MIVIVEEEGTGDHRYAVQSQLRSVGTEDDRQLNEWSDVFGDAHLLIGLELDHRGLSPARVGGVVDADVDTVPPYQTGLGFTLALSDNKIISLVGLVTGISAALSMAASDYLSSKAEGDPKARKSAVYTGVAYFFTVILLILPFLVITSKFLALGITLATAILIIFVFNYYISTAKDLNFKARFLEMATISMGVAAFSFFVGYALKFILGVDV